MPSEARYSFDAAIWQHEGGSWRFVSVPEDHADDIEERFGARAAGFGSIRVEVVIGSSAWTTSLFPDAKRRTYVLPVKKSVRTAEQLADGAIAHVEIVVL